KKDSRDAADKLVLLNGACRDKVVGERVRFRDVDRVVSGNGEIGRVILDRGDRGAVGPLVSVGMVAGDRVVPGSAADGAGGGRAVAPIDGGGEFAGGIGAGRISEGSHRAAEGLSFGGG